MPKFKLTWTEQPGLGPHHMHVAKDASGVIYRIRPVFYYRSRKFAGYRVAAGNVQIRGFKTMLYEAKLSAQRYHDRQRNLTIKTAKSRGKRVLDLDLDTEPMPISILPPQRRVLDLG